jgi:hypothetical protein
VALGKLCDGKKVGQRILQSVEGRTPKVAADLHEFEALRVSAHFAQLETVIVAESSGGVCWATSLRPTSDGRQDTRWAGDHDVLSERDWIDATRDQGNTVTIFLPYRPPQGLGNRRRLAYESRGVPGPDFETAQTAATTRGVATL